jgi:LysM repeat protein
VLVLREGDTLNLIAERYGTTVATLRRINPQLESTQTITAVEGDSLAVLAGRHGTTEGKLRSLNPVLQQSEPYITGEGETLSSVAAAQQISLSLLRQFNPELASWPSEEPLPGTMPSTELPAGEWIYLPARRSAPAVEEAAASLG